MIRGELCDLEFDNFFDLISFLVIMFVRLSMLLHTLWLVYFHGSVLLHSRTIYTTVYVLISLFIGI